MHQPRKRFGQHFLHDTNIIDRIIRAIDPREGEGLVEIGPGQGALTYPLLKLCKSLIAVELDRDLVPVLKSGAAALGNLEVINEDVLKFDLSDLKEDKQYRLIGNLPYNISTPLMFHLLNSVQLIQDMHFMVQKEVALRIVADSGEANFGRLSVMLQYHCQCQYLFDVAPSSFSPPPKVDSAVIRLIPHQTINFDVGNYALFSKIVQTAFGQRRKTISNSLKSLLDRESIQSCQIDPGLRAENLGVEEFARLSLNLSKQKND